MNFTILKNVSWISSVFLSFTLSTFSVAADFELDRFQVLAGDINGDGLDDLYIDFADDIIPIHGDVLIPITLLGSAQDYIVYSYEGVLDYFQDPVVISNFDSSTLSLFSGELTLADLNNDGVLDIKIAKTENTPSEIILAGGSNLTVVRSDNNSSLFPRLATASIDTSAVNPVNDPVSGSIYYGVLDGEYSVDELGAFVYDLPIEVAPGINGLQPELSLTYDSESLDGIAGWGWGISGLSNIARCNASFARDGKASGVNPTDDYRFCLDGERLVEVNDGEYRLEVEKYYRIKRHGGTERVPDYWTLEMTDGETLIFGQTDDSEFPDGSGNTMRWSLSEQRDVFGNKAFYNYNTSVADGTQYISSIIYGGSVLTNSIVFEYESRPDVREAFQAGRKEVENQRLSTITVNAHSQEVRKYQLNYRVLGQAYQGIVHDDVRQLSLLNSIDLCFAGSTTKCVEPLEFNWSQTQLDIRSGNTQQFTKSGLSEAENVESGNGADNLHHPTPTVNGYFDSDLKRDGISIKYDNFIPSNTTRTGFSYWTLEQVELLYTGKANVVLSAQEADYFYANERLCDRSHEVIGDKTIGSPGTICHYQSASEYRNNVDNISGYHSGTLFVQDLNGDGRDDILNVMATPGYPSYIHAALIATDDGFQFNSNYLLDNNPEPFPFSRELDYTYQSDGTTGRVYNYHYLYRFQFTDLNGDGLVDVLRLPPLTPSFVDITNTTVNDVSVALNNGNGFDPFQQWFDVDTMTDLYANVQYGDVNGDGLLDIVSVTGAVALNDEGKRFVASPSWRFFSPNYGRYDTYESPGRSFFTKKNFFIRDINGDGLGDYVYLQKQGIPQPGEREGNYWYNNSIVQGGRCQQLSNGRDLAECNYLFVEAAISSGTGFGPLTTLIEYQYPLDPTNEFISGATWINGTGGSFDFRDMNEDGSLDLIFFANKFDSVDSVDYESDHWFAAFRNNYWTMPQLAYTVVFADGKGGFLPPKALFSYECIGSVVEGWERNYKDFLMLNSCGTSREYSLPSNNEHKVVSSYKPLLSEVRGVSETLISYAVLDKNNIDAPNRFSSTVYTLTNPEVGSSLNGASVVNGYDAGFVDSGAVSQAIANRNLFSYAVSQITTFDNQRRRTDNIRTTYRYKNARVSIDGYGSLGFEEITKRENHPDCGYIETVTLYHQQQKDNYKLAGVPKREQVYAENCRYNVGDEEFELDGDRTLISDVKNAWGVRLFSDDIDAYQSPHYFPFMRERSVSSWGLNGTLNSHMSEVFYDNEENNYCQPIFDTMVNSIDEVISDNDSHYSYTFGVPEFVERTYCADPSSEAISYIDQNLNISSIIDDSHWIVGLVGKEQKSAWSGANIQEKEDAFGQTRTIDFTYNNFGEIASRTVEPSNTGPLYHRTTYAYDEFGYVSSMTEQVRPNGATDFVSRTTNIKNQYINGNLVETRTNPLSFTETTHYEPKFAQRSKYIDFNGLVTESFFDETGRTKRVVAPSGSTFYEYRFCEICFEFSNYEKYYVNRKTDGSAAERMFFDVHDREVGTRVKSLDGQYIYTFKNYDRRGNEESYAVPFFDGSSIELVSSEFDLLDRTLQMNYPDGTRTAFIYDTTGPNSTRQTNQQNQTKFINRNPLGWITRVRDPKSSLDFKYTAFGDLSFTEVNDQASTQVYIEYDLLGRRTSLNDPNTGLNQYTYNGFGHAASKIDGNGVVTEYKYDKLDRNISRIDAANGAKLTHTWIYDSAPFGANGIAKGYLAGVDGQNTDGSRFVKNYTYTSRGLVKDTIKNILGEKYVFTNHYDTYDRLAGYTYPSGFALQREFNGNGFLTEIVNANTNERLWRATESDQFDNISNYQLGNTESGGQIINVEKAFEPIYGRVQSISAFSGTENYQNHEYVFSPLGNLTKRTDKNINLSQCFGYDTLNRLTAYGTGTTTNCSAPVQLTYDDLGNITSKVGIGNYTYGAGSAGPNAVTNANGLSYQYDNAGNFVSALNGTTQVKSAQYTAFNKPYLLTGNGNSAEFIYSPEKDRIVQIDSKGRQSIYPMLNDFEVIQHGSVMEYVHYLGDWGTYTVNFAANDDYFQYLLRDHIDSVVARVGESADIEFSSYDPWGLRLNENWAGENFGPEFTPINSARGFTNHEHLDGVGLIHMNGRVYDPLLGRFLIPDTLVQAPYNTQNYNRYSYVFNNPLSFTDPSGYACVQTGGLGTTNGVACTQDGGGSGFIGGLSGGLGNLSDPQAGAGGVALAVIVIILRKVAIKHAKDFLKRYNKQDKKKNNDSATEKNNNKQNAQEKEKEKEKEASDKLNTDPDVTKRPVNFRKKTLKDSWDNAADGSKPGTKQCPTCGKDVEGNPHLGEKRNGPNGWDNDHQPKWKDRDLSDKDRKGVLDEYNKDTRLRCPSCNRADNQ